MAGGTGNKFATATIAIAGVASAAATLLSIGSIWLQTKNYRKPLLQRYVVRILLMVPIYSIASWASMISLTTAAFLDPIRDIYEAFTIYTFFQLLINYLGGERALIILTHGREPIHHLWPLNHVLEPVDISDPHTFLAIKRGILQYAWLKPILALSAIVMKATNTYQEGYIGLSSGYMWSGILYNISVTVSLYSLGLFWVCMHQDLKPFRPVPKFLCIKLVIFASYWQGFLLSILVWLGAIPDQVEGYTPDNLAAAIQDFLICIEMPFFAIAHWYAFSWYDFADDRIASARMRIRYAFRDAFGIRDLVQDSKVTFKGDSYGYRFFDSGDKIMAHETSKSRLARLKDGMRYERGGKGKYWIPRQDEINQTTPLLRDVNGGPSTRSESMSPHPDELEQTAIDLDDEALYESARQLEFGDWNYPVITVNGSSRQRNLSPHPSLYQHTPTGSYYNERPHPGPAPSPQHIFPLDKRRRKRSGEDPGDKKGKKKAHIGVNQNRGSSSRGGAQGRGSARRQGEGGKDPLEIAYGPILGINPQITEADFEVDVGSGQHRPAPQQQHDGDDDGLGDDRHNTGLVGEESNQWGRPSTARETQGGRSSPQSSAHEDECANVWGRS